MDKNKHFKKRSFTIIELIITISIIIVFSGLIIPFFNQFNLEQQLKNESKKVINFLELARKKAISGDLKNFSCVNFTGYLVTINTTNLQIYLCCGSATGNSCLNQYQITTYNLPSQISVTTGLGNFQFKNLTGQTTLLNQLTITIRQTAIGKCANIYISPSGLIDFDSNLTSC